jgi:MtN3 and saliva related transmembrane protein
MVLNIRQVPRQPQEASGVRMDAALIIGYLASVCSVCSFVPQVWKFVRTGDTEAISARMYCLTVTGFALWTAFGIMRSEWPSFSGTPPAFCCLRLSL